MTTQSDTDDAEIDTQASVTLANASRYPLMRRLDAHWNLEGAFAHYDKEICRVSGLNTAALASLGYQERRLKEMQSVLRSSSSCQTNSTLENSISNRNSKQRTADNVGCATDANGRIDVGTCIQTIPTNFDSPSIDKATSAHMKCNFVDTTNKTSPVTSLPDAPINFTATEITSDSFTAVWNESHNDGAIIDYEIRYSCTVEGKEKEVTSSCSRWCLKRPLPNGRFVVQNLVPSTEYRSISIRRRNARGWSELSNPINCLTMTARDEDHSTRRRKFIQRIGHLEQSIQSLEAAREQLPAQQVLLARDMSREQDRILELNEEIERVVSHNGNELLSSRLLHGISQAFKKSALKQKLEQERTLCKEHVAQWRAGIIGIDKQRGIFSEEIDEREIQLNKRKAALQQFDRRHAIVSNMRPAVSEQTNDFKKYHFARWKSRVSDRLDVKKTLASLAHSCRRRIYARAWLKLSPVETRKQDIDDKAVGIGGLLLNFAEKSLRDNLAGAANLIGEVNDMKEEHSVVSELGGNQHDQAPTIPSLINMLGKEDDRASLMKGDFLFRAGHFASSLKIFQQLQSKMESCEFFDGMSSADAAGLHSEVNGKIGHVYMKLASFDLAIVHFGRQLSLAEEENLGAQKTCALLGLGTCYLEKYDCLYAETLLKRALDLCLSRGDNANTLVAYTNLKKTYEVLNRPEAAVFAVKIKDMDVSSWKREFGGTAVSRHEVKDALKKLDSMTLRLSNTYPSQVIKLEAASSHQVQLQKALSDRDRELIEALEHLTVSELESKELQGLLEQIEAEIIEAKYSKKNTLTSILLQGSKQDIKTATLQFRLEEELKIIRAKLANSLAEISATNMMIHNARDDVAVLKDEICVEGGPLMGRVLTGRKYRCASFNVSNVIRDDVCGVTTNGEWVALSEGQTCYIHSLRTGNLKHVFIDNEDGCTVSSLFFYGDRVYTGTMGGGEGERASLVAWHIPTSKMLLKAKAHGSGITSLWADDSKIVSGSADKSIILWSVDGVLICRVCGHSRGIHSLLCGPKWLVSASHDTVFVWDIKQTEKKFHEVTCRRRLVLSEGHVTSLYFGELDLITGDNLGSISVWWVDSGLELQRFKAHDGPVTSLQVDAVKAVSCGLDMAIKISDVIKGLVLQTLRGHTAPIITVAFDRKQIISISADGEVRYWYWDSHCCPISNEQDLKVQKEIGPFGKGGHTPTTDQREEGTRLIRLAS